MEITTYSNFRQNLKSYLDKVFLNHDPLFVKRSKSEDVVILSKTDYNSMQETLYLLSNPKNAERLSNGIENFNKGKFLENDTIE